MDKVLEHFLTILQKCHILEASNRLATSPQYQKESLKKYQYQQINITRIHKTT